MLMLKINVNAKINVNMRKSMSKSMRKSMLKINAMFHKRISQSYEIC